MHISIKKCTPFWMLFALLFFQQYGKSYSGINPPIYNAKNSTLVSHANVKLPSGFKKIVIDPGHGGIDEGCKANKIKEKDVSLKIAKALGNLLHSNYPELEIIYTRSTDRFVSLQNRIAVANNNDADLFISIHCNYVTEKYVSGTETYVLGQTENEDAQNLISKEEENESNNEFIESIQFKKLENHAYIKSLDFASKIESSFANLKGTKSRGVRHGGFRVLQMTSMPSVLIETGFLSNQKDQEKLNSYEGQNKIAKSIFGACVQYFKELHEIDREGKPKEVVKYHPPIYQPIYKQLDNPKTPKIENHIYSVQIASYNKAPLLSNNKKWQNLDKIEIVQKNDQFLYLSGEYSDLTIAKEKQQELIKLGIEGAFVVIKSE